MCEETPFFAVLLAACLETTGSASYVKFDAGEPQARSRSNRYTNLRLSS